MRRDGRILLAATAALLWSILPSTAPAQRAETGGVGMWVAQLYNHDAEDHRGNIIVLDVFRSSPAERGGIEPGDIILEINDQKTSKYDFQDLLENHLRGPGFSDVTLKIFRTSTRQVMTIPLFRVPMVY